MKLNDKKVYFLGDSITEGQERLLMKKAMYLCLRKFPGQRLKTMV